MFENLDRLTKPNKNDYIKKALKRLKYATNQVHIIHYNIVGKLCDPEVASSATADRQGSILESCVWRAVSAHSSYNSQEVLLVQFST